MSVRFRWPALAAVAAVLAGCGVPTGGAAEPIASSAVPYGLTAPPPRGAPTPSAPAGDDRPRIYLIDADDVLVPSGRDVPGATVEERMEDLLTQLAAGPNSGERDHELTTALPPRIRLSVTDIDEGRATVDLSGQNSAPSGQQSRRAVGQIVLSLTSLPEVSAVLLTRDGEPLEAPLPSGQLTTAPLTAADYEPLLVAPPS